MVCSKCESKLSKVVTPDPWRNTRNAKAGAGSGGPIRSSQTTAAKLIASKRKAPYSLSKCIICKQRTQQDGGKYCQTCAYAKGVCPMCGVQVLDISMYRQSEGASHTAKFEKGKEKKEEIKQVSSTDDNPAVGGDISEHAPQEERVQLGSSKADVKKGKEERMSSDHVKSGWEFDNTSGYFYDPQSGYYYDPNTTMYYHSNIGRWINKIEM